MHDSSGCKSLDSFFVPRIELNLNYNLTSDSLDCNKPQGQISFLSQDTSVKVLWHWPNGDTSSSRLITVRDSGYHRIFISLDGCVLEDSVFVYKSAELPVLSTSADTINCNSGPFYLYASGNSSGQVFDWTGPNGFQSALDTVEIFKSGQYICVLSGANGCSVTDTVLVIADLDSPEIELKVDTINCEVDSVYIQNDAPGLYPDYRWSGPSQFTSRDEMPLVGEAGRYYLEIRGQNACVSRSYIDVVEDKALPNFQLSSSGDTLNCLTDSLLIQAALQSDFRDYYWIDGLDSLRQTQLWTRDPGWFVF